LHSALRRHALAAWIAASAGGLGALGLHASAMESSPVAPVRKRILTAQTTEGPDYLAGSPTRADVCVFTSMLHSVGELS